MRQAPAVRQIPSLRIYPLRLAVIRGHPNAYTCKVRSRRDFRFSCIEQRISDSSSAKAGQYVQIDNFRNALVSKRAVRRLPLHCHIPDKFRIDVRDEFLPSPLRLIIEVAFELFDRFIPANHSKCIRNHPGVRGFQRADFQSWYVNQYFTRLKPISVEVRLLIQAFPPDSTDIEPDQVIVASQPATSHQDHRASTCLTTASQKKMAILA